MPLWVHFKPKQVGEGREKKKIKVIDPFRSSKQKIKKNSKKIKKIKKYHYEFISNKNEGEIDEKKRK